MYKGLAHIGIMTENPDKCAAFYIDNLGFEKYHELKSDYINIVMVKGGGLVLEFIKTDRKIKTGIIDHLCIEVTDIEKTVSELRAAGVDFETEEVMTMNGLFPFECKNIFFEGPAGERVELFDMQGK